ncbi:NADPH-dependent 7-cyano-7-deazaguanine reductase QueF [Cognatilysobacter lacus]|uniref:NADPH-dependent 7-cyano-7-deazaguanine reductase n=1 Tax=Cognatilysobacter lacus TaxID=1643323 RepID=A0A5D8Z7J6_9GAMM|nr:NADPH-dependent 7-cyano-7-deazaguanine reductase QueF [Lysobacter lacus]TZF90637.1 NADPH-dependent 7-cyano-7-deazaguanine reductase QueF [Lysobacter lacus]
MTSGASIPLGRHVDYPSTYDASLLFPIARAQGREAIGIGSPLPFVGHDRWHAYELSWLDSRGMPHVATATLVIPAHTPNLIESKSLKLYFNSFNATVFDNYQDVRERIAADLSRAAGGDVLVSFGLPPVERPRANVLLDTLETDVTVYGPPDATLLAVREPVDIVEETLTSALLKSNCPVTGQPDWARVTITYRGRALDHASVLRYIVSFRDHCEFHEQCVERIFADIMALASPSLLSVEARYTRRGGLDINPWRGTPGAPVPAAARDERQ